MARWSRSFVIPLAVAAVVGTAPAAGQTTGQDTLRPPTPEEYQAMRRRWLEARRLGILAPPPVAYGSAVVGLSVPGAATGAVAPPGGVPPVAAGGRVELLCEGWSQRGAGQRIAGPERGAGAPERGIADAARPTDPRGRGGIGGCYPGAYGYPHGPVGPYPGGYGPGYPGAYGYGPGSGGYGYPPTYGQGGWDPLNPVPPAWSGWTGATEYAWSPWGPVPLYPYGWRSTPGSGYGFSWPGSGAGECALVTITAAGGVRHSIAVGVQTLGLADLGDLDLAIDMRLSQGQAVTLLGMDGRVLRLTPGPGIEDIRVGPCIGR